MDAALIGGPNQGSRVPGGTARRASNRRARPWRQAVSRAADPDGPSSAVRAMVSASESTKPSGSTRARSTSAANPAWSVAASAAASSVQAR
jgi:hypothetical protein